MTPLSTIRVTLIQTPSNHEFLSTLFGTESQHVHVTDFSHDPGNIPPGEHLRAWMGDYYSRYWFGTGTNQYFTISTFSPDDKGKARRRKALFKATYVIVLDDVKEKLSLEQAQRLPTPTWILETSEGSEQWGYKLSVPCTDRHRVDNLLDGLVESGLAPAGKDPGMKGVTRYVRLPEGFNSKASKLVNGQPFDCRMLQWNPFNAVTLEELAGPFSVNLDAERREQRIDGAASVSDHPLLGIPDIIHIKEERSDGRFDITCPWIEDHTDHNDDGSAIFTNQDGTIGFKCHHGACQERTGADLLEAIAEDVPGFSRRLKEWQIRRSFEDFGAPPVPRNSAPDFFEASSVQENTTGDAGVSLRTGAEGSPETTEAQVPVQTTDEVMREQLNNLKIATPFSEESRELSDKILQVIDGMNAIDQIHWQYEVKEIMHWTKPELKKIISQLRKIWYEKAAKEEGFFQDVIFIKELNQFYDNDKRIFYSTAGYENAYSHLDAEVKKTALQGSMVQKADKIDYAPLQTKIFERDGTKYANSWSSKSEVQGHPGDISCYLNHFDTLGWSEHRDFFLKYLAYTIRHPDKKINFMLLLGSAAHGTGKDWLLYPLIVAMGDNSTTIDGDELISGFSDYAIACKHLNLNEIELSDHKEATRISSKIKPLVTTPPDTMRCNIKNIRPQKITNLLSVTMTTNSSVPLKIKGTSRRIFALWSDLIIRDEDENVLPEWEKFWTDAWNWMKGGGAQAVIHYLRHEVDLTGFKPGASPPMTDYLREMTEASKSPMQQTVDAFVKHRVGCFKSDLVTVDDMSDTLKSGELIGRADLMYCDYKFFTPARIGCIMRETEGFITLRAKRRSSQLRLWVVREPEHYKAMSVSQLMDEYDRQMADARSQLKLKAV